MTGQDAELEQLRAGVSCAVLLERNGYQVDEKESTRGSQKWRRGAGEIVIVSHEGRGWWDPQRPGNDRTGKGDVDDGKDSVHVFTQALRHPGVTTAPAAATRTTSQSRARVPPRRGRWREEMPDEASARRFVPEAMRGGDTGTLTAQQPCGTVQGRRAAPSHLSCNRAGKAGLWAG